MSSVQKSDFELADYTGVLRRTWRIVLAVTAICLIGAVAYIVIAPKSYTATATVYVSPTGASHGNQVAYSRTSGSVDLDTEAALVTSGAVETRAARMLRTSLAPSQLGKLISLTVPGNTTLLNISCSDSTAAGAAVCAQDFALAYLQNRSASAAATLSSQAASLQAKITTLQQVIAALNTEITGLPAGSGTRVSDQDTESADKSQLRALTSQLATLNAESVNTAGGRIVTAAAPPGRAASPDKTLVLPSGLITGLLLGLVGAFVWDRRDSRLQSAQDVEQLLGLPVLLSLPRFGRQIALASPRSRTGQAFLDLAHAVTASLGEGSHVVLVTGATPGPAASVVAANLAATLARTHSEAVLVCADPRDSVSAKLFGVAGRRGLAEVVAGRATVGEVACGPAGVPGLWVIPPGADPSLVEYHLQGETAKALTTQLRRDARYVIVEAHATQDTFALAETADTALLTIETRRTRLSQAEEAIPRLRRMRIPLLGAAVLFPLDARISVRPPKQAPDSGAGADGADGALTRRSRDALSALSPTESSHPADPMSGR